MKVPSEFDPIRPYEPEELQQAYDRLLHEPVLQQVLAGLFPGVPMEQLTQKMRACKTNVDFQRAFCYPVLMDIIHKESLGIDIDATDISIKNRYTFVSNHRDIVLD